MTPGERTVDAVVFDLGGVLADFSGVQSMRELSGIESDAELWRRWLSCEWVRRFERGHCSPEQFADGLISDWRLAIDPDRFLAEFTSWVVGPYEGAADLVQEASARATVACLSNTNSLHWEAGAARWPLLDKFDHTFLSFQIGMVKPDPEIFQGVVRTLNSSPDRILFLDDNEINVAAARTVGVRAEAVRGVDEARSALTSAGVLSKNDAVRIR